jgi:hypothetical protein
VLAAQLTFTCSAGVQELQRLTDEAYEKRIKPHRLYNPSK